MNSPGAGGVGPESFFSPGKLNEVKLVQVVLLRQG